MNDKVRLEAELQGVQSALDELEAQRKRATIAFGTYLQLKKECQAHKKTLERELENLPREQPTPADTLPEEEPLSESEEAPLETVQQQFTQKLVIALVGVFLMLIVVLIAVIQFFN
jgi:hypothetical protein